MRYKIIWPNGARVRSAPRVANTTAYELLAVNTEWEVIEVVPDINDPNNANKSWGKFSEGRWFAILYPSSVNQYEPRAEIIVPPYEFLGHTFLLGVSGSKVVKYVPGV